MGEMTSQEPPVAPRICEHLRTGKAIEPRKQADGSEKMMIMSQHCLDCGEQLIDASNPIPAE